MVLTVVLENNVWVYYPGQTINGNVVVTKNIWHKIEGLSIRFLGKMEFGSAASAAPAPPQDTLPQSYHQNERKLLDRITRCRPPDIVLDHRLNLLHNWKVLKPGSHEFPFSFTIPDGANLPESVKIDGFRVLYEFVVVLRRPRDDYKVYQTPFYVQTRFGEVAETARESSDSVAIAKYLNPLEMKTESTIGFCVCCKSGPYGILFRVPKRIIGVGQNVDFVLEVWNETRLDLQCAKILLVRVFKHKRGLETKKKHVISEVSGPSVPSGQHEVWASCFRVPANTPPTNFVRRDIFEINYVLKALITPLNQANKSISVKCPLFIIRETESLSHFDIGDVPDSCIMGVPPPTYEEAMGLDNVSATPLLE